MGITKTQVPSIVQPVYNNSYLNLISNNVTFPNFHYVFDIYIGSAITPYNVTSINAGRYTLLPRYPQANVQYTANGIIQNYLDCDLTHNITGGTISSACCAYYTIWMGEQSGTTVFTGTNSYNGFALNAAIQYDQLPSWNYNNGWLKYRMNTGYTTSTSGSGYYLTSQPSSVYIRDNERASLSFLNFASYNSGITPSYFLITTYQISGGTKTATIYNRGMSTGNTTNGNFLVNHLGTGVWNINAIPASEFVSLPFSPIINTTTDYKYDIRLLDQMAVTQLSRTQTYVLDTRCTKYTPIRFMFLNLLGEFDYFTAILMSRETTNISRQTYDSVLPYNYSVGDRGTTTTSTNARKSVTVTSDWVTQEESDWLQELFLSQNVFELKTDGTILPIIIDQSSIERKKMINDRLINYDFSYTYSYPITVQKA